MSDDLSNAVGRAYALRLLADRMAADSHWNAVLQGLLAQGMPYETAMLHIQRLQEQQAAQQAEARARAMDPWRVLGLLALGVFGAFLFFAPHNTPMGRIIGVACIVWCGWRVDKRRKAH